MGILALLKRDRTWSWHYERVLGTSLELHVTTGSEATARAAETATLSTIDRLNDVLSGWLPDSEVTRWCSTFDIDVPVSDALREVLELAEQWRVRTAGAFHPGAQAVIEFLRDPEPASYAGVTRDVHVVRRTAAPEFTREQLHAALSVPLWRVNHAQRVARNLTRLPVSLDALAKGYIIDRAAESAHAVLSQVGYRTNDVLLNIGGDVRHIGRTPVQVAIADPFAPHENARPLASVTLQNQALATSGGYHRQFASQGRAVSHLVDPRTLRAAEQVVSSSVVADDCVTADALSTACSVLTPTESIALVDGIPGSACLLVTADGIRVASARWGDHVRPVRSA